MNDTSQKVREVYRALLMKRTGPDRLKMGCAMLDASRTLIRANLKAKYHSDEAFQIHYLNRTYSRDFDRDTLLKIIEKMKASRYQE